MTENNGPLKTVAHRKLRQSDLGVYVWKRACNGKVLADEEGNPLNIPSRFGDLSKMAELSAAARAVCKANGLDPEGTCLFWDGQHRVTEEEYAEQVYDMVERGIMPVTNKWENK